MQLPALLAVQRSQELILGLRGEPTTLREDVADFLSATYGSFPLMIGLIAVLTFLLLARAFARCSCL